MRDLLGELPDSAEPQIARAPARVNVIGEHTDYNDGLVLPTTSALYTWVAASRRNDDRVNVRSLNVSQSASVDLKDIAKARPGDWSAYVFGVIAALSSHGIEISGADIVIRSDMPLGGGLSSSAALELAVAHAILGLSQQEIDTTRLAELCRQAEIEFAGVNCGLMDQLAVASCRRGHALRLDCRNLSTKQIALPDNLRILLTDSGVKHELATSEYNRRAAECAEALTRLTETAGSLESLRDVSPDMLRQHGGRLGDKLTRRCRHVLSENQRVLDAANALEAADTAALGKLVSASHVSLRDDYEVSCDAVDQLIAIADQCAGVHGSRMVGGGFGGCVLSIVEPQKVEDVEREIRSAYRTPAGWPPWTHVVAPAHPASTVQIQ